MSTGKNEVDLQAIIDNPGKTVEELRAQVKGLAQALSNLIYYIDNNLYDNFSRRAEFEAKRQP